MWDANVICERDSIDFVCVRERVCVCVCVTYHTHVIQRERARESERERDTQRECVCVRDTNLRRVRGSMDFVCVREGEGERECAIQM